MMVEHKQLQVKKGCPHDCFSEVLPICNYCVRNNITKALFWKCGHPNTKDNFCYEEPCCTNEWKICPFNVVSVEERK